MGDHDFSVRRLGRRLLTPQADSLVLRFGRFSVKPDSLNWYPLLNLVWLFWIITSPWFSGTLGARRIAITYASVAVFLTLYHRAWYGQCRRATINAGAICVLGLIVIPANYAAWSYIIYGTALLPLCLNPRTAVLWIGVVVALFFGEALLAGFGFAEAISSVIACIGISGFNLYFRQNALREAELKLSHDEVRRLATMAERERIGRDLHDLLGHTLSLIAIKSELADKLFERDTVGSRREIRDVQRVAREALAQVRSAVTGIRAAGLAGELASAKLLLEASGVHLQVQRDELELPQPLESAIAMILREAVTNVHRHAAASSVRIVLGSAGACVDLRVQDDGCGGITQKDQDKGNGLSGLCARIRELGGTIEIDSPPRIGTTLLIKVPKPAHRVSANAVGEAADAQATAAPGVAARAA
ncbi:MAG: sensor histidine kinase [Nevskia sp.]|nr:sensor histidine kinase [Nevskia sp.]